MWWSGGKNNGTLVCFDFDGVIADSLEVWHAVVLPLLPRRVAERLHDRQQFLECFTGNLWRSLRNLGCRRREVIRLIPRLGEVASAGIATVAAFPGMIEAVNLIAARWPTAIVTSNHTAAVTAWCAANGITGLQSIQGADVSLSKVRKLRRLRRTWPGRQNIYIGDTVGDCVEAKQAGWEMLGVAWGWHGEQRLAQAGATIIADPGQLSARIAAPA